MSQVINRKDWARGWNPSADDVNGPVNSLLRMDNLYLDEQGTITMTPGYNKINTSPFAAGVHSAYSKVFNNTKYRYVGLADGTVLRDSLDFSSATNVIGGGSNARAVFRDLLGLVVVSSGQKRIKDDTVNQYNLGIEVPKKGLGLSKITNPQIDMGSPLASWTAFEGTNFSTVNTNIKLDTDSNTLRSIAQLKYSTPVNTIGTLNVNLDTFELSVQIGDSDQLKYIRIEFLLEIPGSDTVDIKNYYYSEVHNDDQSPFNRGVGQWSKVAILRSAFKRAGGDTAKDWKHVYAIRCIAVYKSTQTTGWGNWFFFGGDNGQLNGRYDYRQSNCNDNGVYVGESPLGPSLLNGPIFVRNGSVEVTPLIPSDPQVNKIRIYRRNVDTGEAEEYYQVLEIPKPFSAMQDNTADVDAAIEDLLPNLFLNSFHDLTEEIVGMVGIYYERLIVMTLKTIYLSQSLNIDSYDPREVLKLSSSSSENNCWIAKVSEGLLYAGTTHDIYAISGTLETLPDGTIDVQIRPLGIAFPPISKDFAVDEGNIYYMSADGWRVISGATTTNINGDLDLLFKGTGRYGVAPVSFQPNLQAVYPCAIAKKAFWTCMLNTDSTNNVYRYRFSDPTNNTTGYWTKLTGSPTAFYMEEDGTLLSGHAHGDNYLREFFFAGSKLLDLSFKRNILFQTIYDDNQQPRNRKDTFTLKVVADSGGDPVNIAIAKDKSDNYLYVAQNLVFNGLQTHYITIANIVGLGKRFSVRIDGVVTDFKITEFQLEYDPRPEQLTYLRIPNTNLGTPSRKRFINFAYVIDTLGNSLTFTPLVDGVAQNPTSIVNLNRRGTFVHYFPVETVGTDIGGILQGTDESDIFEFYELDASEIISEKMPPPATFLRIPQDDYGSTSRKRFSSYKFRINTRGGDVVFTPHIDGQDGTPQTYNTTEPTVCEYYFLVDTFGINIGGSLTSLDPTIPFEFYGALKPELVEKLPERLEYFKIPENNYGVAARKRLRTIPMQINTYGFPVLFTPIIDGVPDVPTTIITPSRRTTYHYFNHDVFAVDIAGELLSIGGSPFEFYGLMSPENVETLPVPKMFDQVGPFQLDKIGKIKQVRIRVLAYTNILPIKLYMEDEVILQDTITTVIGEDRVYETLVPKGTNGTVFRMEIGPVSQPFHRWNAKFWVMSGGDSTQLKVITDEERNYAANLLRMGVAR